MFINHTLTNKNIKHECITEDNWRGGDILSMGGPGKVIELQQASQDSLRP